MSDALITKATEVSVLVPSIWSKNYYDVLLASLPFEPLISRDYEGEISTVGDRVKISTVPEFADATVEGEADQTDADAVTVTQQELVINYDVRKDFKITNRASLQAISFVDKLKLLAIYSIQKKIQSLIISLIVPSASGPDHQIAYDSSTTLALADILEVKELLDTADVPSADRHVVLGPAQLNDIFNIAGFTSSDFVAGANALTSGDIPARLLGFMPHFTTEVGNVSYWFHQSFMGIASQKGMTTKEYDQGFTGLRATRINNDTLLGIKQLDNTRVATLS